jgi:hypothetical protein
MIVRDAPAPHDQPFAIAQGKVEGAIPYVDAAINALAYELALAQVRGATVEAVVRRAAERNAQPQRPPAVIDGLIVDAFLRANRDRNRAAAARRADAARRGIEDEPASERERTYTALRALIQASLHAFVFDKDTSELDAVWSETGDPLHLPLSGDAKELQKSVTHVIGSLDVFARRAHEKARKADVVAVLQELARTAPRREKASEDSEPVQLVEAILSHRVLRQVPDEGGIVRPGSIRVRDLKGIHAADGVAIWEDRRARRTFLVVHFASLAGRLQNPQFRFKRASQLRELFLAAPGALPDYYSPAKCREVFQTNRTYAVDIEAFESAASKGRMVNTSGGDSENAASDASSASDSTETPSQQAFSIAYESAPTASETLPTHPSAAAPSSVGSVGSGDMFETLPADSRGDSTGYECSEALEAPEAPF